MTESTNLIYTPQEKIPLGDNIASVSNLGTEITAKSRNEKNVREFINTLNTFLPPR